MDKCRKKVLFEQYYLIIFKYNLNLGYQSVFVFWSHTETLLSMIAKSSKCGSEQAKKQYAHKWFLAYLAVHNC